MCAEPRIESMLWGSQHLMPDTKTRLKEQWETCGGGDETLVCEVLQPSIYDSPLHVCFPVEWKGGHAGLRRAKLCWAKACGGRGWDPGNGGGRRPHTLNTALWKRNWQPQINSTFQWIISSFGCTNPPLPSLSRLHSLSSPPPFVPTNSFYPPSTHPNSYS